LAESEYIFKIERALQTLKWV